MSKRRSIALPLARSKKRATVGPVASEDTGNARGLVTDAARSTPVAILVAVGANAMRREMCAWLSSQVTGLAWRAGRGQLSPSDQAEVLEGVASEIRRLAREARR